MLQPPGASNTRRPHASNRRKTQESPDDVIRKLQRLPPNKKCCDCNSKLPSCVNLTVGSFVCMACAGLHRQLSHKIKGVGHSNFTDEEAEFMKNTDNDKVNAIYLARFDPARERMKQPENNTDQQHLNAWIHRKYHDKAWFSQQGSTSQQAQQQQHPQPTVAQIPPQQQSQQIDLFGGSFHNAPSAPANNEAWDAFGDSKQQQTQNYAGWDAFGGSNQMQHHARLPQQQNAANYQQPPPSQTAAKPNPPQQQQQQNFANFQQQQPIPPQQQQNFGNFQQQHQPPPQYVANVQHQQPPPQHVANVQHQQNPPQQQQQHFANFQQHQQPSPQQQKNVGNFQHQQPPPQHVANVQHQQPPPQQQQNFGNFQQQQPPPQHVANVQHQQNPPQQQKNFTDTQQQQPRPPQQQNFASFQQQQQNPPQQQKNFTDTQQQQPRPPQQQNFASFQQQQPQQPQNFANFPSQQPPPQQQQQGFASFPLQKQEDTIAQKQNISQSPRPSGWDAFGQQHSPRREGGPSPMPSQPQAQNDANVHHMPHPQGPPQSPRPQWDSFGNQNQMQPQRPHPQSVNFANFQQGNPQQTTQYQQSPPPQQQMGFANFGEQPSSSLQQHTTNPINTGTPMPQPVGFAMQPAMLQSNSVNDVAPPSPPQRQRTMQEVAQSATLQAGQQGFGNVQLSNATQIPPPLSRQNEQAQKQFQLQEQTLQTKKPIIAAADAISNMVISGETPASEAASQKEDTKVDLEQRQSKFKAGQKVYYKSSSSAGQAEIMKVHFDDELQPFYTVKVDGREKQTDDDHLFLMHPLFDEITQIISEFDEKRLGKVKDFVDTMKTSQNTASVLSIGSENGPTTGMHSQMANITHAPSTTASGHPNLHSDTGGSHSQADNLTDGGLSNQEGNSSQEPNLAHLNQNSSVIHENASQGSRAMSQTQQMVPPAQIEAYHSSGPPSNLSVASGQDNVSQSSFPQSQSQGQETLNVHSVEMNFQGQGMMQGNIPQVSHQVGPGMAPFPYQGQMQHGSGTTVQPGMLNQQASAQSGGFGGIPSPDTKQPESLPRDPRGLMPPPPLFQSGSSGMPQHTQTGQMQGNHDMANPQQHNVSPTPAPQPQQFQQN